MLAAQQAAGGSGVNLALVADTSTSFVSGHETITRAERRARSGGLRRQEPRRLRQLAAVRHAVGAVRVEPADQHRQDRRVLVRRPPRRAPAQGVPAEVLGRQRRLSRCANAVGPGPGRRTASTPPPSPKSPRPSSAWSSTPTARSRPASWNGGSTTPGKSPNFPPAVEAGVDRVVVLPGKTYLSGHGARTTASPTPRRRSRWSKDSGPGDGHLRRRRCRGHDGELLRRGRVRPEADGRRRPVERVGHAARRGGSAAARRPPGCRCLPGPTRSPARFWSARLKKLIVNWIPHCFSQMSDPKRPGRRHRELRPGRQQAGRAAARAAHGAGVRQRLGLQHGRVDVRGADGRSAGRPGDRRRAGRDAQDARRLDPQDPRRPGARRLPADVATRSTASRAGRTSTTTRATWPATSSRRPSPTT